MTPDRPEPPSRPASQAPSHWESPLPPPLRLGFLAIGRKRPGFDPEWGAEIEARAWTAVNQLGLDPFRPATRAVDDASLRRALAEIRAAGCDTLVVLQPTMGDGRLAPVLAQVWNDPLVFWATPERQDSPKVSSCSLVGTHVFATIFRQLARPFEILDGHPDDANTRENLTRAVRLTAAGAKLRRAKVGLVGSHAPGFLNMQADPAALHRELGVVLHRVSLVDFFERVESGDDGQVEEQIAQIEAIGLPAEDGLSRDDLAADARYYLAMRTLMAEENLDALAVRCWPELPRRFRAWPYLAMARLAGEGQVVALEGDVDGAVSCLIGRLLGLGVGYLSDWLEHDEHSVTLWHPGHAPLSMCTPGTPRLGRHFNNGLPLVVNATLAADRPSTLLRLWRCDGFYHMTACDARTEPPRRELLGAHGRVAIADRHVPTWFATLCHAGMPHHLALLPGHQSHLLRRFARQMGVRWVEGC